LDARLADYTLDFSAFPSSKFLDGRDGPPLPEPKEVEEDKLSDVGGPEDFTANMERYLMGEGMSSVRKSRVSERSELSGSASRYNSTRSQQPAVEEDVESGEISEFGPPVDMSTPSHLLHRTSALARDSTQLEDIEEDPNDELSAMASPSERKMSMNSDDEAENLEQRLQQRIAELEDEVQNRDEQLHKNRKRVLEAVSAVEQIRHLQAELQLKNEQLEEITARSGDEAKLREQIDALQRQNDQREKLLQQSTVSQPDLGAVEQQLRDMQKQLQSRDSQSSLDAERLETISHLRQQLQLTQEQLKKRDETLDETMTKLKDVTRAKEVQLHEKNTEIDRLKGEIDDHALENERLETELERVNRDYETLEDRLTALEIKSAPLEERNHSLEADLTRAQSQVEAQESALKAVAADLPIGSRSTYSEILDLIKDLGGEDPSPRPGSPPKGKSFEDSDLQQVSQEISRLQQELQEATASQKAAEAEADRLREQLSETQNLIKTIEKENSRLTTRVEELTSNLNNTQHELTRTQEEHAECLETIARLEDEALDDPPSQPPSPPQTRGVDHAEAQDAAKTAELEATHQAQIRSLQTVHSTAISTLRSSHAESMRKIRNSLTTAEQREAEIRTELTTIRASIATQESQLRKTFKSEIRRLEAVIAAKDETAAAVDERIALSVDRREREWERRVDLLLKERDRMAKALMMYWGEKEMGKGPGPLADGKERRRRDGDDADVKQGQAYKYKYAQKHRSRTGEKKV
jgi:chromosome segregation ATPase